MRERSEETIIRNIKDELKEMRQQIDALPDVDRRAKVLHAFLELYRSLTEKEG